MRFVQTKSDHIPVLLKECLEFFSGCHLKVFFEGTLGAGGHAKALLEAHPEIERYIGCDQDPEALLMAKEQLMPWRDKVEFVHANFATVDEILKEKQINKVDGFFLTWECRLCN